MSDDIPAVEIQIEPKYTVYLKEEGGINLSNFAP